jgi:hypothetical protein
MMSGAPDANSACATDILVACGAGYFDLACRFLRADDPDQCARRAHEYTAPDSMETSVPSVCASR